MLCTLNVVDPCRATDIWPDQQTRYQVSEHDRLFQELKQNTDNACCQHYYAKIVYHSSLVFLGKIKGIKKIKKIMTIAALQFLHES